MNFSTSMAEIAQITLADFYIVIITLADFYKAEGLKSLQKISSQASCLTLVTSR